VTSEVHFALEGSIAHVARERLETRVLAAVCYQVRRLTERLAANYTLVWLFSFKIEFKINFIFAIDSSD
jgi:hypothetical protein